MTNPPWVPISFASHVLGRKRRTIRNWAQDGIIRRQTTETGTVLVHLLDATRESAKRPRRKRAPNADVT